MTYTVSLEDVAPTPLYDAAGGIIPQPFTKVLFRYAPTDAPTAWVDLDTQFLSPVDTDPRNPLVRKLTTREAPEQFGWFQVVFIDNQDSQQATDPVLLVAESPAIPAVDDVARLLRGHTMADGGQVGTFLDDGSTATTASDVEALISDAAQDVFGKIGTGFPDSVVAFVRPVIAVGAALLVIIGEEQVNQERYDRLKQLYDERLNTLLAAVVDAEADGDTLDPPTPISDEGAGGIGGGGMPTGVFPPVVPLDW